MLVNFTLNSDFMCVIDYEEQEVCTFEEFSKIYLEFMRRADNKNEELEYIGTEYPNDNFFEDAELIEGCRDTFNKWYSKAEMME